MVHQIRTLSLHRVPFPFAIWVYEWLHIKIMWPLIKASIFHGMDIFFSGCPNLLWHMVLVRFLPAGNRHLLFDNRKRRKSILGRFFLGQVDWPAVIISHPFEWAEQRTEHRIKRQRLNLSCWSDAVIFVPNLFLLLCFCVEINEQKSNQWLLCMIKSNQICGFCGACYNEKQFIFNEKSPVYSLTICNEIKSRYY